MEGPAKTGESSQTPAPTRTAPAGNSTVSRRSMHLYVSVAVTMFVMRPGAESRGVGVRHIQSTFLDLMDASTDVRALSWPR